MKRLISLFAVLLMIVSVNVPVRANMDEYTIKELGVTLSIPDQYYVLTRNTPASSDIFSLLGISKSDMLDRLADGHIYLSAIAPFFDEEISVTMTPIEIDDFNGVDDATFSSLASRVEDYYIDKDFSVLDCEIYTHKQRRFIKTYGKINSQSTYVIQYLTVVDHKAMCFMLHSYDGDITTAQEATCRAVVNSISFHDSVTIPAQNSSAKKAADADSKDSVYRDDETGVTFSIPADWEELPFAKPKEIYTVKFALKKSAATFILFGAVDLWNEIPSIKKLGAVRADVDDSVFSKSDIAEMASLQVSSITDKTYNGIHYYEAVVQQSLEEFAGLTVTVTQRIHVQDGWMYLFAFSGNKNSIGYSDFEYVMNSVVIGEAESSDLPASVEDAPSEVTIPTEDAVGIIVMAIVIMAGVAVIIILIKKAKAPVQDPPTTRENRIQSPEIHEYPKKRYCHRCGTELSANSLYCRRCGAKQHMDEE